MKERIDAVQRLLWITLGLAVALLIANLTGGNNGPKMAALRELEGFAGNFNRDALESRLLEHARAQVRVPLTRVAALTAAAPGVPDLSAKAGSLEAAGTVALTTLGDLYGRRKASQASLRVVDVDELAAALAFRLARRGQGGPLMLSSIELEPGVASPAGRGRFQGAEAARRHAIETRKRFARAEQKFERQDELLTQRRKWKASRKVISKTFVSRMEAKAERDALRKELDDAKARYQTLATAAEAAGDDGDDGASAAAQQPKDGAPGDPLDTALARVALRDGQQQVTVTVPVGVRARSVGIPKMDGVTFPETHAADLWDAVSGQTPAAAVKTARNAFGWHYSFVGGPILLHLWPLVFPWLLFSIRRRTRAVSAGYDPYGSRDPDLPAVGTGRSATDGAILVALPAIACLWTAYSLAQIAQWPLAALAGAIASVVIGSLAVRDVQELRSFTAAVVASHSQPPGPLPDAPTSEVPHPSPAAD